MGRNSPALASLPSQRIVPRLGTVTFSASLLWSLKKKGEQNNSWVCLKSKANLLKKKTHSIPNNQASTFLSMHDLRHTHLAPTMWHLAWRGSCLASIWCSDIYFIIKLSSPGWHSKKLPHNANGVQSGHLRLISVWLMKILWWSNRLPKKTNSQPYRQRTSDFTNSGC